MIIGVICIIVGAIFDWDEQAAKTGFLFAIANFNERQTEHFKLTALVDVIDVGNSFNLAASSKLVYKITLYTV